MPSFITSFLLSVVLPALLKALVNEGVMSLEQATGIKNVADFVAWAKTLKTYPAGTPTKNDPFNQGA